MTIQEFAQSARTRLERAGISHDEAALDAELLARFVMGGWSRGEFIVRRLEEAPAAFGEPFLDLVRRREARTPTAYLTGRREFWSQEFEVTPAVLVPRPETELIVEEVLARVASDAPLTIVEVGTGSGCLAISLARWLPRARVVAIDISSSALDIARRNAERLEVGHRVRFLRGDVLSGLGGRFDLVVSNPPYIPTGDLATLQPEVRNYEPAGALDGGPDGLDIVRRLAAQSALRLNPGGLLVFEFGFGQAEQVRSILDGTAGIDLLDIREDLAGIPRVAIARAAGGSPSSTKQRAESSVDEP